MIGAMEDDSCRRAGSIPFKWEVCPGTPKHTRSASATAATLPANVEPIKLTLTPPPSMASSPSPYYHHHSAASSPRVSSARSASVSPSRRRPYAYAGSHRRAPPTAFIEAAPRAATTEYGGAAPEVETAGAFGCFALPMLRRKGSSKKAAGFGSAWSFSSSSSGGSSFRSDGGVMGMRRSASISSASSLPLPPGRRYAAEARAEVDAIAATGRGWYF